MSGTQWAGTVVGVAPTAQPAAGCPDGDRTIPLTRPHRPRCRYSGSGGPSGYEAISNSLPPPGRAATPPGLVPGDGGGPPLGGGSPLGGDRPRYLHAASTRF